MSEINLSSKLCENLDWTRIVTCVTNISLKSKLEQSVCRFFSYCVNIPKTRKCVSLCMMKNYIQRFEWMFCCLNVIARSLLCNCFTFISSTCLSVRFCWYIKVVLRAFLNLLRNMIYTCWIISSSDLWKFFFYFIFRVFGGAFVAIYILSFLHFKQS